MYNNIDSVYPQGIIKGYRLDHRKILPNSALILAY